MENIFDFEENALKVYGKNGPADALSLILNQNETKTDSIEIKQIVTKTNSNCHPWLYKEML